MMPTPPPRYKIHKTEKFIQNSQALRARYSRVTELLQSVDWHLMRMPHRFTQLAGGYYLLRSGQLENPAFPRVNILYMINYEDESVTILEIED